MKKRIVSLFLLAIYILCLTACGTNDTVSADLDALNGYAASGVDSYNITICVEAASGGKVTEEYYIYTVGGTRSVDFSIEKINPFIIEGDTITAPDAYKTVSEGTLTAEESAKEGFDLPKFQFTKENLTNIRIDKESYPYTLQADVVSTEALMGKTVEGKNIRLECGFVAGDIYYVELTYKTANGNNVTVTYTYN